MKKQSVNLVVLLLACLLGYVFLVNAQDDTGPPFVRIETYEEDMEQIDVDIIDLQEDVDDIILIGSPGVTPIGSVVAWLKSFPNTPALSDNFVECNGQILDDTDSLYDGQTIPNLNTGIQRFLRGSTTSGATGGSEIHTHTQTNPTGYRTNSLSGWKPAHADYQTGAASTLPSYYEVVWIMRVK